jgi:lambda family phage minor tail protein L
MVTSTAIKEDIQSPTPGKIVTLYALDATDQGAASVYYFTQNTVSGISSVVLGGITYTPLDCEIDGMEFSGQGSLPQPKIRISNVSKTLAAEIIAYNDLLGAKLTRIRTFEKYLDGQPEADPTAIFSNDVYVVERKSIHNKYIIEWELAAYMDFTGTRIPKRQIIKDACTHVYRIWDITISGFDYDNATCPYTGTDYFDVTGAVVSGAQDKCGKKLSDCILRFGTDPLPTRAFPAVASTRVNA